MSWIKGLFVQIQDLVQSVKRGHVVSSWTMQWLLAPAIWSVFGCVATWGEAVPRLRSQSAVDSVVTGHSLSTWAASCKSSTLPVDLLPLHPQKGGKWRDLLKNRPCFLILADVYIFGLEMIVSEGQRALVRNQRSWWVLLSFCFDSRTFKFPSLIYSLIPWFFQSALFDLQVCVWFL